MSDRHEPHRQSSDVNGPEPDLKRVMGPKLLLLFIVGDILGHGRLRAHRRRWPARSAVPPGRRSWWRSSSRPSPRCSYLELVTKYPQAAGAALYTHKAFGVHFVTFLVAFTVMCSGITSRVDGVATPSPASSTTGSTSTSPTGGGGLMLTRTRRSWCWSRLVNFRGVGESVKANVVLTMVELSGLLLVIFVGLYAVTQGNADFSRVVVFESADDKGMFFAVTAATSLAFFAMVGFEDSVNMAEECKDPVRDFPKMMLTGLGVTGVDLRAGRRSPRSRWCRSAT